MRSSAFALIPTLALFGCSPSSKPFVSVGFVKLDHKLELSVFNVPPGADLEVCGVKQKNRRSALVPIECVLPADMPFDRAEALDGRPVPIVVKPLFGAAQTFEVRPTIETTKQLFLVEGLFAAVAEGESLLPRAKKKHNKPGIAFSGYGGIRAIDAKTIGDVDIVVHILLMNPRDTGKTCSYSNLMSASLRAYDADLEAYDAHTGKKLGKKHLTNDTPGCPSSNYGRVGEHNTVSSAPPDYVMNDWARNLEPDKAPAGDDE